MCSAKNVLTLREKVLSFHLRSIHVYRWNVNHYICICIYIYIYILCDIQNAYSKANLVLSRFMDRMQSCRYCNGRRARRLASRRLAVEQFWWQITLIRFVEELSFRQAVWLKSSLSLLKKKFVPLPSSSNPYEASHLLARIDPFSVRRSNLPYPTCYSSYINKRCIYMYLTIEKQAKTHKHLGLYIIFFFI